MKQTFGEVFDNFENKKLSSIWSREKFEGGAVEIQSEVVRRGKGAVKVTIKSGDNFEENENGEISERDEIREIENLWALEGEAFSYSFSVFFPKDFPIVPTRLVFAQWKQYDKPNKAKIDNPLIALRYSDGIFRITLQTDKKKIELFRTEEEIRGRWIDFEFRIKFTREKNGFLKILINKKSVVEYNGATAYSEKEGYQFPGRFHFRFGLYRNLMKEPMTIYFDEYKKKRI